MTNVSQSGDDQSGTSGTTPGIADVLRELDPAYFGLVMSTGIVSIAFLELGIEAVSRPLAWFTIALATRCSSGCSR